MTIRWRLSRTDTILVAVLAAMLALTFLISQENTDARLVKSTLENRARAAEINLAEVGTGASAADLTQALERARSTLTNPFPSEEKAAAFGVDIEQFATKNRVSISNWNNSYTNAVFRNKRYPVVRHILTIEGSYESLLKFLGEVTATPLAVTVESAAIRLQSPGGNIWHLNVEMLVYYVE
ncbi:MAG: hypothetical protein HYX84_01805 [Chloroflexi bacterium]|nr:hypothetical protein [Chloroflexota bacterium]